MNPTSYTESIFPREVILSFLALFLVVLLTMIAYSIGELEGRKFAKKQESMTLTVKGTLLQDKQTAERQCQTDTFRYMRITTCPEKIYTYTYGKCYHTDADCSRQNARFSSEGLVACKICCVRQVDYIYA